MLSLDMASLGINPHPGLRGWGVTGDKASLGASLGRPRLQTTQLHSQGFPHYARAASDTKYAHRVYPRYLGHSKNPKST